ncbi:hypothetical protein D9742_12295 [Escherichia sp. E1V33]|nr:hypothetical protein D9742_12295 [Escherichia sp. E1V33]TBR65379.1 hypothetical protein D9735_13165 [Escherichia sp. E1S7]
MRVVHAGCGVNALSGLQKHANSIYCKNLVGLISIAHQAVLRCHQSQTRRTAPRFCYWRREKWVN